MIALSRRRLFTLGGAGALAVASFTAISPWLSAASALPVVNVSRSPSCGCCGDWITHVRAAGFTVNDRLIDDLAPLKAQLSVPTDLQSCHTAVVDGYAIEGHVPAEDVHRLLRERPAAAGIAVAGMPLGSPGMEVGGQTEPYEVTLFTTSNRSVFARH